MKQVDAIFTADWHVRLDRPVCRTDDYMAAQNQAMLEIKQTLFKYRVPIFAAGDIFHHWKPPPELLRWAFLNFPPLVAIPGQHDLPSNSIDNADRAGVFVLDAASQAEMGVPECRWIIFRDVGVYNCGKTNVTAFPFGVDPVPLKKRAAKREIAMCHTLTWHKDAPPGQDSGSALALLKRLEGFDVVLVGDNHQSFVVEHDGRILVSPGSMMRMNADQANHKPRVYLYHAEDNTVTPHYLPIEQGVITREHLTKVEERDTRLDAFVTRLNDDWEVGLSFEKNMKAFFRKNRVRRSVRQLVMEAMGQ